MIKKIVTISFIVLFIGLIYLVANLKEAYKILPMATSDNLQVPTFAEWREFIAKTGRFKVQLPYVPQYAKESVLIPNTDQKRQYEMYASDKMNGTTFMVNLITYPKEFDLSDPNHILTETVNEITKTNAHNQLTEMKEGLYKSYPSVDFHMINQQFDIKGKAFIIGKTVYLLNYVSKTEDFDEKEYDYFVNSFQLVNP